MSAEPTATWTRLGPVYLCDDEMRPPRPRECWYAEREVPGRSDTRVITLERVQVLRTLGGGLPAGTDTFVRVLRTGRILAVSGADLVASVAVEVRDV